MRRLQWIAESRPAARWLPSRTPGDEARSEIAADTYFEGSVTSPFCQGLRAGDDVWSDLLVGGLAIRFRYGVGIIFGRASRLLIRSFGFFYDLRIFRGRAFFPLGRLGFEVGRGVLD